MTEISQAQQFRACATQGCELRLIIPVTTARSSAEPCAKIGRDANARHFTQVHDMFHNAYFIQPTLKQFCRPTGA
jgi:hypothetical protein